MHYATGFKLPACWAVFIILWLSGCGTDTPPVVEKKTPAPAIAPVSASASATRFPARTKGSITLVTYNVLADNLQNDLRWPALFALFEQSQADIFCLQEVTPGFLDALKAQPWFKAEYHVPQSGGNDVLINGNVICARTPIDEVMALDHRSRQGRKSLVVRLKWNARTLAIATCHLESFLEDGPIRASQLDDTFPVLAGADDAIYAGDFNFGDGEQPDSDHLNSAFTDLWLALHPKDPGFTWNIQQSSLAKRSSFPKEPSRRIDRVFLRSKDGFYKPAVIQIIGDQPIRPGDTSLFPSDHFGLYAEIALTK